MNVALTKDDENSLPFKRRVRVGMGSFPDEYLRKGIRDMRRRMETEVSKENAEYYDIKVGPGGIVDIEFIVQYLKLLHGSEYPSIRVTNTLLSLELLYKEGVFNGQILQGRQAFTRGTSQKT